MSLFFLISDMIDILCLIYSILYTKKIVKTKHKISIVSELKKNRRI